MRDEAYRGRRTGKLLLDARLAAAYDMVPPCAFCADIGADHGKLSAALLGEGRATHVLVADISGKALARARGLLERLALAERATFAVADGLDALDALGGRRAEAACILGMGGDTIAGMLRRGRNRLSGMTLVLGAQTELPVLREALVEIGYRLREERLAESGGRQYIIMRAEPANEGEPAYTERELLLGPCLMRSPFPEWEAVLRRGERLGQKAVSAMERAGQKDKERLAALRRELGYVREALAALAPTGTNHSEGGGDVVDDRTGHL